MAVNTNIGTAWISIVPETDKIVPAIKGELEKAGKNAHGTGGTIGSKLVGGMGKAMKAGAIGVGVAAGGVLAGSIAKGMGRLTAIDTAQAKLKGLGNSADQVAGIMDNALKAVKGTSYGLEEAATTASGLVAAGIKPGKELEGILTTVADTAAIAGVSMAEMGSVFNKVAANGKLSGEEMAMVLDRGIPAWDMLTKTTGKSVEELREMMRKGEIDFEMFADAMENGMGGAAKNVGDTFQGAYANMGAAMGRFGAQLMAPAFAGAPAIFSGIGKAFDSMATGFAPVADELESTLTPALERVGEFIGTDMAPTLEKLGGAFGDVALKIAEAAVDPGMWESIGNAFSGIGDAVERAWPSVEALIPSLLSMGQSFLTITANISAATWTALVDVLNAIAPLLSNVVVPMLEKTAKVAAENPALVQGLVTAFLGFKAVTTIAGPIGTFATAISNTGNAAKIATSAFKMYGGKGGLAHLAMMAKSSNPVLAALGTKIGSVTTKFTSFQKGASAVAGTASKIAGVLGTALTKGLSLAANGFKILGLAMRANPLGAVITIATAAGTAMWAFFTKTEKGREIWGSVVDNFKSGIEWISTAFTGLKDLLVGGNFTGALRQAFGVEEDSPIIAGLFKIRDFFTQIPTMATTAWATVTTAFTTFGTWVSTWWQGVNNLWNGFTTIITTAFSTGWNMVKDIFATAWLVIVDLFTGNWQRIPETISSGWESIKTRFSEATATISEVLSGWWNTITTNWSNFWNTASNLVSSGWEWIKNAFATATQAVLTRVVNWVLDTINNFLNLKARAERTVSELVERVKSFFAQMATRVIATVVQFANDTVNRMLSMKNRVVNTVRDIPDKIRGLFANAGSWLKNAGRNIINGLWDGLKSAWNDVTSWLNGLKDTVSSAFSGATSGARAQISYEPAGRAHGGMIPALANGGRLPRTGPGTHTVDGILGVDYAGMPTARVNAGEFVVNAKSTERYLPLLYAINDNKINAKSMDLGVPGLAEGGRVSASQLAAFVHGRKVNGVQASRSLEGAPYIWGGGHPSWGDCSGTMSVIAAFIRGMRNIAGRYFATGNQQSVLAGWGWRNGTSPGKNAMEISHFNGGPYGGHTSGTYFDENGRSTNLEMGGGRGNGQIGGNAAGSRHPQYTNRQWISLLPGSGASNALMPSGVVSTSVDGMTVENATPQGIQLEQIDWGTASNLRSEWEKQAAKNTKLKKFLTGVYDTGGVLPPDGVAVNMSGKPEAIVNNHDIKTFDKLADNLGAVVTKLDWGMIGNELRHAFEGGDAGYAATARLVGDAMGEKIVNKVAFIGDQLRDMQDGGNIRAYLSNMSATQGLELGDQIGGLFGVTGLKSTFGGVVNAFEGMEDAAIQQVDAADAVTQAEKNLIAARAEYRDMLGKDAELSEKMKRRIEDAETALDKARKAPTADSDKDGSKKQSNIEKAELKLKRVREDAAKELEKNGAKTAEELIKAQESVTEAENEYSTAIGVVGMAAQATGQAQITMALQVADIAVKAVKKVIDWVQKILDWTTDLEMFGHKVMANFAANVLAVNKTIEDQRQTVSELGMSWVNARLKMIQAMWDVQTAQFAVTRAQLEGAKGVASAEAKLQEERDRITGIQRNSIYDMGLLWDSYHNKLTVGLGELTAGALATINEQIAANTLLSESEKTHISEMISQRAKWASFEKQSLDDQLGLAEAFYAAQKAGLAGILESTLGITPELMALHYEVAAAQYDQQLMVQNAAISALKATFEQQKAAVDLGRITEDLSRQAEHLALMSGQNYGMSTPQAMIEQQIAELRQENAQAEGDLKNVGNRIGAFFDVDGDAKIFGMGTNKGAAAIKAAKMTIAANNKQIAELEKRLAQYGGSTELTDKQKREQDFIAQLYSAGMTEQAERAMRASSFGDSQRALELYDLDKQLLDWGDKQTELTRKWEDTFANWNFQTQLLPMEREAYALERDKSGALNAAEAIRATNPIIRDAAATLAKFDMDTAAKTRAKQVIEIHVPEGEEKVYAAMSLLGDELTERVEELEIDVKKLNKANRTTATKVLAPRR